MKKIIYYWSPCLNKVGTVKSTINSAISLAKYSTDFDVRIINVFGEWSDYKKYLSKNHVEVENLFFSYDKFLPKFGFFKSRLSYLIISFISFIPLFYLLKKNKTEYFIAHLITSLPLIIFNIFNFDTKLILRISGYPKLNILRKNFWNFSKKKIFKVTCPTKELLKDLENKKIFHKKQIFLLPDAILNIKDFVKKKKDQSILNNSDIPNNFFLAVGRFTKQKNYLYLIREFQKFCLKHPEEKLLIIGEGELKKKIKDKITELNLSNNIFIINETQNVYFYMLRAKAFILASLWEEVGFVIVEAALSNSLIISSNCPNGPSEFLDYGEAGILFKSNETDELCSKLKFFEENKNSFNNHRIKAKKNCLQYSLFRHYITLKDILDENKK